MGLRALLLLLGLAAAPAAACGPDSDCDVGGGRSYRLVLPAQAAPAGALVFAHGHGGSATGTMRNADLRRLAAQRGLALVALEAEGGAWDLPHGPAAPGRATNGETGYVAAVLDDLEARLPPGPVVLAGFSAGGMLAWTIACESPARFAGFVALSGTFWAPVPESCPAPAASLVHIHGTDDSVVPLAGRPIGRARQGDVAAVLTMYRRHGGFAPADTVAAPGGMTCERFVAASGRRLESCRFAGGHGYSAERLDYAIGRILGAEH